MKRICLMIMLLALLLTGCKNPEPTTVATISPGPVSVTVNSVDEFLASLGHNTEIILEAGYFDLTTASDYGRETGSPYYTWVDVGDGYQLLIQNADMLTICGNGDAMIVTNPRYANVMSFLDCSNIRLENFMAGHTDGGECAGGVIHMQKCTQAELMDLKLYGCGTTGVRADSSQNISVRRSEI